MSGRGEGRQEKSCRDARGGVGGEDSRIRSGGERRGDRLLAFGVYASEEHPRESRSSDACRRGGWRKEARGR